MSKHTQGPWSVFDPEYAERNEEVPLVTAAGEDGTEDVAVIESGSYADARLIAAAPDLYACLRNLYERGLIGGTDSDVLDEVKDCLFAADADFDPYGGDE